MTKPRPGARLPLLFLEGFRQIIDELHRELADQGHPDARPMHGFALQAVGTGGASVAELARRLGVSKQAAAKTAANLERLGYLQGREDSDDRRVRRLSLTLRGADLLDRSAHALDGIREVWSDRLGEGILDTIEASLEAMLDSASAQGRIDLPGWLEASPRAGTHEGVAPDR